MTAKQGRAARFIERHSEGRKIRLWPNATTEELVFGDNWDPVTHEVTTPSVAVPELIPAVIRDVVDDRVFVGFRAQTFDAGDGQHYGSATFAKQDVEVDATWSVEIDGTRFTVAKAESHQAYDKVIYRKP